MNKDIKRFAKECIDHYAKYNKGDEFYSLDIDDLPDFVKDEFAALIIAHDTQYASEATGPDNIHWDTKMLPALLKYLKNSTDKDEAIEFNKLWRHCITDYMATEMQKILDDLISDFNSDHGCTRPLSDIYGIPAYGPI